MKTVKIQHIFWSTVFVLLLFGCSKDEKGSREQAKTVERLDPDSSPLYAATAEAQAKDFTVTLVNGESFTLSDYRGEVVLLNIWATWCAPCREETPQLVDLYNEYKDDGLLVLGVSIDEQGVSVVKPFMDEYGVNYPTVIDNGTIMDKYGPTMGIPTTYIIGKEGSLRYFAVGPVTKKEIEPRILKLLNEGERTS